VPIYIRDYNGKPDQLPEGFPEGYPEGPGLPGPPGADGKDGKDGVDGKDGEDGLPGKDGKDGLPGKDGEDGLPGKDGKDGVDAVSGEHVLTGDPQNPPEELAVGQLLWDGVTVSDDPPNQTTTIEALTKKLGDLESEMALLKANQHKA